MTATEKVLPMPQQGIAAYNEFRAQLSELKAVNAKTIFDYESKEGNESARSYVYKLRRTKTAVDSARKEEKAASLEYGRKVDAEAKEIIGEIEQMIDVHQQHIDAIEQRKKERVAALEAKYSEIVMLGDVNGLDLAALSANVAKLQSIQVDESFAEFREEAIIARDVALNKLAAAVEQAEIHAKEQAELEQLRKEKAEREAREAAEREAKAKAEREEQIRKDAAEAARIAAENEAKLEAERAAKREQELKDAAERAEREKQLAEQRAKEAAERAEKERLEALAKADQQAKEAVEREQQRVAREQADIAAAEAKRRADHEHRQKIIGEAVQGILAIIEKNLDANAIVNAIVDGNIPHLTIKF